MALAIDGSTPAKATAPTLTAATTASFTPPNGALLVALVNYNAHTLTADNRTVSGGGLTWTLQGRKSRDSGSTGGAGTDGGVEIWTAISAGASMTVTSSAGTATTESQQMLKVLVFTGNEASPGGAVAAASNSSGLPSASVTTTRANSWVIADSTDWTQSGAGTAGTNQTIIDENDVATQYTGHVWRQNSTTPASGTSVTCNLTAPSAQNYNILVYEVREPAVATGDSAGPYLGPGPARIAPNGRWTPFPYPSDSGSATVAGTASLTGTGTLSADGVVTGAASLTGAGSLTALVTQGATATATGAGSVAATVVESVTGSLTGSGTLTGSVVEGAGGTLTGAGTLNALATQGAKATLTGAGTLLADSGSTTSGTATLTGAGSLTATGTVITPGTASLAGAGALSAKATQVSLAALSATGLLTGSAVQGATATLTGAGTVDATGTGATHNATSTDTVTAGYTSTTTVSAARTSTATVSAPATSTASVSDG